MVRRADWFNASTGPFRRRIRPIGRPVPVRLSDSSRTKEQGKISGQPWCFCDALDRKHRPRRSHRGRAYAFAFRPPCPLATNIAAVSFIARRVDNAKAAVATGVPYPMSTR